MPPRIMCCLCHVAYVGLILLAIQKTVSSFTITTTLSIPTIRTFTRQRPLRRITTTTTTTGIRQQQQQQLSLDDASSTALYHVINPTSTNNNKPVRGDIVTVTYHLNTTDTLLFDYNTTVSFVLFEGNYLPDLHQVVSTLSPNNKEQVYNNNIPMDAGYGERNLQLLIKITKKDAKDKYNLDLSKIQLGTNLLLSNGFTCSVVDVTEDDFTIDANPSLAGIKYSTSIRLDYVQSNPFLTSNDFIYSSSSYSSNNEEKKKKKNHYHPYQVMTIALGCFWGGELMYMRIPGVVGTSVGYTQGKIENPSYKQVCTGTTGHTEAIQVIYDSSIVSYESLIQYGMDRLGPSMFLLNQVGNDRGTQYRHGIYYHNDVQKDIALKMIQKYGDLCFTECKPASIFYKAEDYHQQYLFKGGQSAKKKEETTIRCYG